MLPNLQSNLPMKYLVALFLFTTAIHATGTQAYTGFFEASGDSFSVDCVLTWDESSITFSPSSSAANTTNLRWELRDINGDTAYGPHGIDGGADGFSETYAGQDLSLYWFDNKYPTDFLLLGQWSQPAEPTEEEHWDYESPTFSNGNEYDVTLDVQITLEDGTVRNISETVPANSTYSFTIREEQAFTFTVTAVYPDGSTTALVAGSGVQDQGAETQLWELHIADSQTPIPDPDNPDEPLPEPDPEDPLPAPDPEADDVFVHDRNHTEVTIEQSTLTRDTIRIESSNIVNEIRSQSAQSRQHLTDVAQTLDDNANLRDSTRNAILEDIEQNTLDTAESLYTGDGNPTVGELLHMALSGVEDDSYRELPSEDTALQSSIQSATSQLSDTMEQSIEGLVPTSAPPTITLSTATSWPTFTVANLTMDTNPFHHFPFLETFGAYSREVILWLLAIYFIYSIKRELDIVFGIILTTPQNRPVTSVENLAPGVSQTKHYSIAGIWVLVISIAFASLVVLINTQLSAATFGRFPNIFSIFTDILAAAPLEVQLVSDLIDTFIPLAAMMQLALANVFLAYVMIPTYVLGSTVTRNMNV
jgi:hypothetical protein